jgi:Holliday junction resolvase RusA-like endonuclease
MQTKTYIITGQIRGGKNNITVTRAGRRFPNAQWAKWRDVAVLEVLHQRGLLAMIEEPTSIRLDYFAGDHRRRDMPAIVDAIFHVLEKAGAVKDDTLLWITESTRNFSKANPRAEITILTN